MSISEPNAQENFVQWNVLVLVIYRYGVDAEVSFKELDVIHYFADGDLLDEQLLILHLGFGFEELQK